MGLNEQIKNSEYKVKTKRDEFWLFLFFAVSSAWFIPDLIGIKEGGLADVIKEKGFLKATIGQLPMLLFIVASILSIRTYLFFDYRKYKITRYFAKKNKDIKFFFDSEYGKGFGARIEELFHPDIKLIDPIPRKPIKIFKDYLYAKEDKDLLFGAEHHTLVNFFEKDTKRDFYDFFKIIEASLGKYIEEIDNSKNFMDFRAEDIRKNGRFIVFSVSAIKSLLDYATDDFERYFKGIYESKKNTRVKRHLVEFNPQMCEETDVLKMRVIFKFVLFHKIINYFCKIPVGLVNSRCLDYDMRSILSIYQEDGMFVDITAENTGEFEKYNSDIFSNMFLITYHTYIKNTKKLNSNYVGYGLEDIFKHFDPLHSLHNRERDKENSEFMNGFVNGILNNLSIERKVLDNLDDTEKTV